MTLRRNLELKAHCGDLAAAEAAALALGARRHAVERQRDTFYVVPRGRLKLREIEGAPAVLIAYHRADDEGVTASDYVLVDVLDPAALKLALAMTLGVRGEVVKERVILLWHNVRIHCDRVDGLGSFVEFEAVVGPGAGEAVSAERLDVLSGALGLGEPVAVAYADLLGL